ncbi:ATP-NAD kinase family protein [Cognaticolwellia aestuarii]|uniref:ATP-NAD kinase family protein n=1 Tax=Cognaticolwellia aestuarii TaxID=329993 RepID=UPI000984182F|nr:ATP-NAD kinase family protein [Cognaticolwellia aestuarii]
MKQFKLGLVINPIAGIGGSVALKGSDGVGVAEQAMALGATAKSNARASLALEILLPYKDNMTIYTVSSDMGESTAKALGFTTQVVHQVENEVTTERDTELAVKALIDEGIDLLLFAGGDGTARNVCHIVDDKFPVLGIPAGCKIHSGVYAITPKAAGRVVELMITNQLVSLTDADVMDIDESLFREGIVKAKRFGEMRVPSELRYIQAVKSGGKESDELVLQDIAADVIAKMDDELFIIGSGSTTAFVMEELALENTLLGVDAICQQALIASDLTEADIWQLMQPYKLGQVKLVITLIGGQGHIFGRGNQQLSPRIIRAIKKENIMIIATKAKLNALQARPLIADTGDSELDMELSGYLPVITGYNDQVLYPVASPQ